MRWIVTKDHHGGCIGLGEDADGVPARGKPEDGDALPAEFRLYTAQGRLLFEGRCGDIAADWWHGMEPLLYAWTTFRCRRLTWRPAETHEPWRPLRP